MQQSSAQWVVPLGLYACQVGYISPTTHCKNRSVLSTLICPNTHTKTLLVCVLGQITHFCFYSAYAGMSIGLDSISTNSTTYEAALGGDFIADCGEGCQRI